MDQYFTVTQLADLPFREDLEFTPMPNVWHRSRVYPGTVFRSLCDQRGNLVAWDAWGLSVVEGGGDFRTAAHPTLEKPRG